MANWHLFHSDGKEQEGAQDKLKKLVPPPWRKFSNEKDLDASKQVLNERWTKLTELAKQNEKDIQKGKNFRIDLKTKEGKEIINAVNAAIYLRRPLLVTGRPGSGKTSLAYAIAYELGLGAVLSWAITARSTLQDGLYRYDAIARLQDTQLYASLPPEKRASFTQEQDIGEYITLGALGTAFLPSYLPRVLLIDEIDKSDINLPNDLLNLFEEGKFPIQELARRSRPNADSNSKNEFSVWTQDGDKFAIAIKEGKVSCHAFPIIVMTSNGERDFPPAFKRRCLRVTMPDPQEEALKSIVKAHFGEELYTAKQDDIIKLIKDFVPEEGDPVDLATDQLLNTIYLLTDNDSPKTEAEKESIKAVLLQRLNT